MDTWGYFRGRDYEGLGGEWYTYDEAPAGPEDCEFIVFKASNDDNTLEASIELIRGRNFDDSTWEWEVTVNSNPAGREWIYSATGKAKNKMTALKEAENSFQQWVDTEDIFWPNPDSGKETSGKGNMRKIKVYQLDDGYDQRIDGREWRKAVDALFDESNLVETVEVGGPSDAIDFIESSFGRRGWNFFPGDILYGGNRPSRIFSADNRVPAYGFEFYGFKRDLDSPDPEDDEEAFIVGQVVESKFL